MAVSPLFLVPGIGMILIGVGFVLFWGLKFKPTFRLFLWGALGWIVGVALKFIWSYFMNPVIYRSLYTIPYAGKPVMWIYVGLLTGIFEVGVTLLFVRFVKRLRNANWYEASAAGVGFGSIEAILLGLGSLISVIIAIVAPQMIPANVLDAYRSIGASPVVFTVVPILERFAVIFAHAVSVIWVIYAVRSRKYSWFWYAFLLKTGLDVLAAYGQLEMDLTKASNVLLLEAGVVAIGLLSAILWMISRRKFGELKP